jgi:LysM repeat protein
MKLKNILLIAFSILSFSATASSLKDSLRIENLGGKKIIIHQVEPKETYYSIGRKYNVSPKSIMDFNHSVALGIGTIIKVPTEINFQEKPVVFNNNTANNNEKRESTHVVQVKETLYGIATKYNMRVEDLKQLNKLGTNNLKVGQTLKVLVADGAPVVQQVVVNTVRPETPPSSSGIRHLDSTDSSNKIEIPKNRYGITEKNEKGVAVTINDESLDNSKSYALHSLAPVGTIIKINNPMTNRSVFAKVVGKYTENANTKDVIIVINKAVSEALGALDKRFLVNITYGLPNEYY